MDFLVKTLLVPYANSQKHADFILNYEIFDTNPNKISQKYTLIDYYLTQAQLDGFMYKLNKLKGTHVLGISGYFGHREICRARTVFCFVVLYTKKSELLYFYDKLESPESNSVVFNAFKKLTPNQQYIKISKHDKEFLEKEKLEEWVDLVLNTR
ncbi:hypothetical protein [Saccharibacillus sacchari]|uniref:hypothetical protein n=1 Tax=Saccharibacillus sacchari TaxID=456493 RepID=UPI0006855CFB|nr:hypothetical protein [Saccharibacillus sacchari]